MIFIFRNTATFVPSVPPVTRLLFFKSRVGPYLRNGKMVNLNGFDNGRSAKPVAPAKPQTDQADDCAKARVLQGLPVAVLRGDEAPATGFKAVREWAVALFKQVGGKVDNPALGEVTLDERAVRDSIAHGMSPFKALAFAAVPQVIAKGVVVASGRHGKIESHYISAPVKIRGVDDVVTVLVHQDVNNKRMYLHSVATKESLLKSRESGADAVASEWRSGKVTSGDVASVLHRLLTFKL